MENESAENRDEKILKILNERLMILEDVEACMLAKKEFEGVMSFSEEFKQDVLEVWDILKSTMDELFSVIANYSEYGLDKVYFELGVYDVMFFVLPGLDTALVAIVPSLANRGLLEVELENARREIITLLES